MDLAQCEPLPEIFDPEGTDLATVRPCNLLLNRHEGPNNTPSCLPQERGLPTSSSNELSQRPPDPDNRSSEAPVHDSARPSEGQDIISSGIGEPSPTHPVAPDPPHTPNTRSEVSLYPQSGSYRSVLSKAGPSTFDDMAATVAPYPLGLASFSALGDTRPLASVSTAYSGYGHWTLSEGSILNHKPSWIGGIEYTQPSPTAASRAPQKCLSTLAYASNTKEQAQEIVRDTRKRKFEADPPPMTAGLHKFALDMKKKRQTEEEPTKNITRIDLADLFNRLRKIEHLWSPTDTDGSDGIFMQIFNDPRRRPLWDSIQNAEVQKEFVQPYSITTGYATQCRRLQAFQTDALPLRWPYPVYSDMNVVETTAEVTVLVSDMDGKSPWICGHPGCLGPRHTVQTFTRFQGRNDHDKEHHIPVGHYLCPGQCCLFSVTGHRADLMRAHILHDHPQLGRSYLMHESSWKRNPRNVGKFFPKSEHELQNPNIATFRTTGEMCPKLPRQAEWNIRYSVREMKQEATREQYKSIVSDPFGFAMYADKTEWRYQVRYITIDKGEDIPQGRRISYCPGRTDEFIGLFGSASFRVHR